jgi:hypothetical protein
MPFNEFYRIADGQNALHGIVGNLETKLPFKFERQFDHVQAICAKVVNEAGTIDDLVGINNKLLDHDCPGAFGDVDHVSSPHVGSLHHHRNGSLFGPAWQTAYCEFDQPIGMLSPALYDFQIAALRIAIDNVTDFETRRF